MSTNQSLVYGIHPVTEILNTGKTIEKIFIQKSLKSEAMKTIAAMARSRGIVIQSVPVEMLNRITRGNHQGVAAKISPIDYIDWRDIVNHVFAQGENPLLVILDGITDVRNAGAIVRTAYAAGAHAMIVPSQGFASFTPDAVKASAGALHKMHIARESDLVKTVKELRLFGIETVVADAGGDSFPYELDLKIPLAIILGNEEKGPSPNILRFSTRKVKLPMPGEIDSYNVSVAAGMLLYEVMRQRMKQK